MSPRLKKKSKRLAWLLRHGADDVGLTMDAAGWVLLDDLLPRLHLSPQDLQILVRSNNKQRYELTPDRIRATQGHSHALKSITHEALEASWNIWEDESSLWHGTQVDALESIAAQGLLPQQRTHVHLAASQESKVGKRSGSQVLLEVSPQKLRVAGQAIFESPNGVVLVRAVPPGCIVGVVCLSRRAKAREGELVGLFASGV